MKDFIILKRVVGYDEKNGPISKEWAVRVDRIESFEDGYIYLMPTRNDVGEEVAVDNTLDDIRNRIEEVGYQCV